MRVLVCCVPQAGHFNPMAPLLRSLVAGGDEVLVAGGDALRRPAESVGARYTAAGGSMDEWFGRLRPRTLGMPGDGLSPERILHYFVPRLFAEIGADDMVEGVLATAEQFAPDLLVHDSEAFAGPLIADILNTRSVQHQFGPLTDPEVLQLADDAVRPLWRRYGREAPPLAGMYRDLTIGICPPSLEKRTVAGGRLLHLQPAPPPIPAPQAADPQVPLVYVSFGTLWADSQLIQTVLDALADEPVQLIVTTGQLDPSTLRVPDNARAETFIPQAELLPRCAAVIHHAGAGTQFGALAHGLPQVAMPQAADNFLNAEMLAVGGAGQVLLPHQVDPDSVRNAIRAVLGDERYRVRAQQVAAEIAAMPTPDEVAEQLRVEISAHRPY